MTGAPSESPFANRTVIVLGPVRSGTTWLVELLLAHPALAGLSWESTIFMALWDLWENAHRADGEGISAYLGPDEVAAALRGFCDRTFSVADGEWFVEKTPDNVNRIPLISAAYPLSWGVLQLGTGALSDRWGRRPLIVGGMALQGLALAAIPLVLTGLTSGQKYCMYLHTVDNAGNESADSNIAGPTKAK